MKKWFKKCPGIRDFFHSAGALRGLKYKEHLQYYQQELGYWKRILLQFPRYLLSKFSHLVTLYGQNAILQIKWTLSVSLIAF